MNQGQHAAAPDTPPSLSRGVAHAAGALLVPCLIGVFLRMGGAHLVVVVTATITTSIFGIFVGFRSLVGGRSWPGVAAMLLFTIVPFVAMNLLSEARWIGVVLERSVEDANGQPFAAGFVFSDGATPRTDLAETVTVVDTWSTKRGSGQRQDTYVVAPVVPPSWTPGDRVHVVAIAASRHEYSRRVPDTGAWTLPGGVLRTLDEELEARAVTEALQRHGLDAVGNVVVGTWVPSPGIARLQAALPGLAVVGAALVFWALVLVVDRRDGTRSVPSVRR